MPGYFPQKNSKSYMNMIHANHIVLWQLKLLFYHEKTIFMSPFLNELTGLETICPSWHSCTIFWVICSKYVSNCTLYQTFNVKAEKRHTLSSFASRHSMSCSAFSRDNLKYKEIFCCKDIIKLLSWTCKCLDILYLMHFCCRFQQTILTIIIKLHIIHLYVMSQFPLFSAI